MIDDYANIRPIVKRRLTPVTMICHLDIANTRHPLGPICFRRRRHHHPQILTMIVWRTVAGFSLARTSTMGSIPDTRREHFVKRNVKRQFFGPCESDFLWPSHENSSDNSFFCRPPLCVYFISEFEKVPKRFAWRSVAEINDYRIVRRCSICIIKLY